VVGLNLDGVWFARVLETLQFGCPGFGGDYEGYQDIGQGKYDS